MAIHVNSPEEALADMKKRGEAALQKAISKVADVGAKDVYQFSISCIDQYYANYSPSIYDRTYQLYNTVSPVCEVSSGGDSASAKIGVRFDAGALGWHSHRTFWGWEEGIANGHSADILNDFLDGIHPMTDGSPLPGAASFVVQDGTSTDSLLDRYLRLYLRKMEQLVKSYFAASL